MTCAECNEPVLEGDYLCSVHRGELEPIEVRDTIARYVDMAMQLNQSSSDPMDPEADPIHTPTVAVEDQKQGPWVLMDIGFMDNRGDDMFGSRQFKVKKAFAIFKATGALHEIKYGEVMDDPILEKDYRKMLTLDKSDWPW